MGNMRPPHIPETPPAILEDAQLKALLATVAGTDFDERRDAAMLRLFLDSGLRRAELAGLRLEDVDFLNKIVLVLGKGRRPRAVPFGRKTAQALDRYLRARARHADAGGEWLWLGKQGRLNESGIAQVVRRRGVKPASRTCTHTCSDIPSRTQCSLTVCRKATSCGWPAGAPARWLVGTVPPLPTSAPAPLMSGIAQAIDFEQEESSAHLRSRRVGSWRWNGPSAWDPHGIQRDGCGVPREAKEEPLERHDGRDKQASLPLGWQIRGLCRFDDLWVALSEGQTSLTT